MNKYQLRQLPLTIAIGSTLAAGSLQAATITVDSTNDGVIGTFPYECTLRAAVAAANSDAAVDGCVAGEAGLDQIDFDQSLAASTISIADPESPFEVTDSVSINGPQSGNAESIFIQGGNQSRVFEITGTAPGSINVSMDSLSVENGYAGIGFDDERGGGIASSNANLTLTDVRVTQNYAYTGNGGIDFAGGALTMTDVAVVSNSTGYFGNGGGLAVSGGTLAMNGGAVSNNDAAYDGGGLLIQGGTTAVLDSVAIENNESLSYFSGFGAGVNVGGNSNVTVANSSITGNSFASGGYGGGVALLNAELTVTNSQINNNAVSYYYLGSNSGGGIFVAGSTLTLRDSSLVQNSASSYYGFGAAIAGGSSTLEIERSKISDNSAYSSSLVPFFRPGGAIALTNGSTTIRDSEISFNRIGGDFQSVSAGYFRDHALSLTNVTISENSVLNGGLIGPQVGSVLQFAGSGSADFLHVTLADNQDSYDRFGIYAPPSVTVNVINSVFSGAAPALLCNRPVNAATNTLATDVSCTGVTTNPVDLDLRPLSENGGPTMTNAVQLGSVAIDAGGDCATDFSVVTDQRGVARDANCDLGAFEFTEFIFSDRFEGQSP